MTERHERLDAADEPDRGADDRDVSTAHLDDVEDGCGCAEVWEHLSERRDDDDG
jgi:hypothetical protein